MVAFEVEFLRNKKGEYFKLVDFLQKELVNQEGLISIERFESIKNKNRILSLQIWKNKKCIIEWKNNIEHKKVQRFGKDNLFKNFNITVSKVIDNYSFNKV